MTRSEWKAAARARLGGGIFKDQWLMGVVFCLAVSYTHLTLPTSDLV